MLTKQFHDEAVLPDRVALKSDRVLPLSTCESEDRATVMPMLMRLLLNGWITDKEKVFLDTVAPEDCLTFLIRGETYLHPEDLELFPFEVIETTTLHGGEAIFSHHYQPSQMKTPSQQYRIFSAAVNPGESEKIILGFFGPSHRLGTINEDHRFCGLVNVFRTSYAAIRADFPALRRYQKPDYATLLVNRSSGRVLTANEVALDLLNTSDRNMVDIGLDQLKYHLTPLLPRYNLKMDNIALADIGLSIVTLEPNVGANDSDSSVTQLLENQLTTSAATIGLVTRQLDKIIAYDENKEAADLIQTLRSQADQISAASRQFSLLANYGNAERSQQSVLAELEKVVNNIISQGQSQITVQKTSVAVSNQAVVPKGAFYTLFDVILGEHLSQSNSDSRHRVLLQQTTAGGLRILFETRPCSPPATVAGNYSGLFTEHLCRLLGIKVIKNLSIDSEILTTELTLKK